MGVDILVAAKENRARRDLEAAGSHGHKRALCLCKGKVFGHN